MSQSLFLRRYAHAVAITASPKHALPLSKVDPKRKNRTRDGPTKKPAVPPTRNAELSDSERYYRWASGHDAQSMAAVLVKQGTSRGVSELLYPRHARILEDCLSFWKSHFVSCAVHPLQDHCSDPVELSQTLSNIYNLNCRLTAFANVCIAAGEVSQFLRLCDNLRRESTTYKGLQRGILVLEPRIYEMLAQHFASKADWHSLEGVMNRLKKDGLHISPRIYLSAIECLGRLLHNTSSRLPITFISPSTVASPSLLENVLSSKLSPRQAEIEESILRTLSRVVMEVKERGFTISEVLLNSPRSANSVEYMRLGLDRLRSYSGSGSPPDPILDQNSISFPSTFLNDHIYPVEKHLGKVRHRMVNPNAGVFHKSSDLLEAFERQFALEKNVEVPVNPVLPPFSLVCHGPALSEKKTISPKLKEHLVTGLIREQARWRHNLLTAFKRLLQRLKRQHTQDKVTVYPFLKILPPSQYVDLMIKAVDHVAFDSALQHISSYLVCLKLGGLVEAACNLYRKEQAGILDELKRIYTLYGSMFNTETMKYPHFRHMWLHAADTRMDQGASLNQDWPPWPSPVKSMVGRALYSLMYDQLTFNRLGPAQIRDQLNSNTDKQSHNSAPDLHKHQEEAPVLFEVCAEYPLELRSEVKIHPTLAGWYRDAQYPPLRFDPAELPMLCPPVPWTSLSDAGYLMSRNYATRLLRNSDLSPVSDPALQDDLDFDARQIPSILDALNCLASCPWRVNEPILDSLIKVAREGGNNKLSMPETTDQTPPSTLCITKSMNYEERRLARRRAREAYQRYNETVSLWSSELYRLSIANQYRGKVFWFPHSMDFRGRVYPCPPHFHHMGCDIARGLIVFAKGMPLGPRGLDWLKIHLVNLTGSKKRAPVSERLAFADTILDDVIDSAKRPFDGRLWWQEQEEPWQTLACCMELTAALEHDAGPEAFVSHFPVHQDGSCNGLQHYAALGRDVRGAESVNLTNIATPQDVYSDVVEVVEAQRRVDAAAGVPVAQALEGFVLRKVIKQSVMTTVYGVTLYGASQQIRKQLKDLPDFPNQDWIGPAGAYLARVTLASIGSIFTSSTEIQSWFGQLARHIARHLKHRVRWETPLGLPVIQPYMSSPGTSERDYPESSPFSPPSPVLSSSALEVAASLRQKPGRLFSETRYHKMPIPNPIKQRNAFPPNFIHSLDSCHMMLTALHCFKEGITFASVHDCFWTHAATVDEMNRICREEFIALHKEPILKNFSSYLRSKFASSPEQIDQMTDETKRASALAFNELLNRVPKPGSFDINEVKNSTYFFS
ncbi:unnamed protein product [Calicophoron daubneyi]|uniref:DNA-directed RNA polymerase n=1 Tax=Calicophoron daubneyi TaxID=300641 RepID=A0AAV2TA78_CALDB